MSGRVDAYLNATNYDSYHLYKEQRPAKNASEEAVRSIHQENKISTLFFSRQNIDYLQEAIRYLVYTKSCNKHIIDKQSEPDLLIIMRAIYLQYAKHLPYKINDQIKQLNTHVLNFAVPQILQEIKQYLYYRKDISALPIPMDRGEFISAKGTKVLEQTNF